MYLSFIISDCHYNREDDGAEVPQGEDDDIGAEAERASDASLSSRRSSITEEAPVDAEFEQKINRLIVAKQKLRQLQNLVAMVQVCFELMNNVVLCQNNEINSSPCDFFFFPFENKFDLVELILRISLCF